MTEEDKAQSPVLAKDDLTGLRRHQTIALTGRERAYTIHNYEVNIHATPSSLVEGVASGSSKVQITTLTNQNWELPAHPGNMVASNNHYLSYILEGRSGYVLRLIHQETNTRALLKGFTGPVLDVAFAHATSNLLGCVDQGGNVFVWDLDKCEDLSEAQSAALRLHSQRSSTPDHTHHRLTWCPYIPQEEEEGEEEEGWLLAVSHDCLVEVYSLGVLFSHSTTPLTLQAGQEVEGKFTIPFPHDKPVLDLSLSPDGSVLATSSEDGHLKFWQVDWDTSSEPKCLHDFSPHRGAPVSRLMFCDNHTTQDPMAQFWRFLITGANQNTEVKLWCTVTWKCLQTFHFLPPQDGSDSAQPHVLLSLDLSASYLLATDTRRMTLYIFQLAMNGLLGEASLTSITEYLLTQPILSFTVSGHTPFQSPNGEGESGEEEEEEEEERNRERGLLTKDFDSRRTAVLVKLYCIHTKSMQELLVKFEPPDIVGIPPDPLPVPLFSGDLFSSEPARPKEAEPPPLESQVPEEENRAPSPLDIFQQPSSLPASLHHTPTTSSNIPSPFGEGFHSLPSQPGTSSVLVTPSAFLSPAKVELPPSSSPSSPLSFQPFSKSPQTPSAFEASAMSFSSSTTPTLTSVTMVTSAEPSDATLSSMSALEPLGQMEHKLQEREEGGRLGEGEGEGEGERDGVLLELSPEAGKEPSNGLDEVQPQALLQHRRLSATESSSDEEERVGEEGGGRREKEGEGEGGREGGREGGGEGGEVTQERFSSIFGLMEPLGQPALKKTMQAEDFDEYQHVPPNLPAPLRPQQIFPSSENTLLSSPEKSEFVAPMNRQLTPTREEGTEIVNTTGTPSAEYFELFNQQRKGSASESNEMVSSYPLPSHRMSIEKLHGSENAASAWPDVMGLDLPKLSPRQGLDVELIRTEATPSMVEGAGLGSEVSEVGQMGLIKEELERGGGGGGGAGEGEGGANREREEGSPADPQHSAFSAASSAFQSEPTIPNQLPRISQTTEGETGQTLPAPSDQPTPELITPYVGFPSVHPSVVQQEEGGEGGEGGGGEGEGDVVVEEEGEEEVEVQVEGGEERRLELVEGVEESTGAAAPQPVEMEPPGISATAELTAVVVGGGAKGRGRKRKSKSKQPSAEPPAASYLDVEPSGTEVPLLQVQPPLLAEQKLGVESDVDHTHLYQLVAMQQEELKQLREDQQRGFLALQQQLDMVQRSLLEHQQLLLTEHAREQQQKMDRVLKDKQALDRQRQDKLISTVSQTLTSAVNAKLEKVVKSEMKSHVTPAVNRSLAAVQEQLSSSVQQRLTATNTALREGITQITQSKGLPEAVGAAVAGSIQKTVQGTYEEMFRAVVLPAFERSSQEMFRQVDEAFRKGTAEYLSQLQQQFYQLSDPSMQQLTSSYHSLHSLLTSPQSPLLANIQQEMRSTLQSTYKSMSDMVCVAVQREVEAALQRHVPAVSPEVRAREERAKKEEEIRHLIQSQNINSAFELALSTSDLHLVLFLCQQVTAEDVFDKTPCPLSQPVLLSLIQQLSVDLSDQVELKIGYLEACVLALDVNDDVTKSHKTRILQVLSQQLPEAERSQHNVPNSAPLLRKIKRLRMITDSLSSS